MSTKNGRSLDELLAELPRELAPQRDLWPGIARAVAPRRRLVWPAALAAGVIAAAVSLPLLLQPGQRGPGGGDAGSAAKPVSFEWPQDQASIASRAALERTFRERLQLLAPDTRARIEADLQVIRNANADIRAALAGDPASPVLQRLLFNSWEQEMDLYRDVARATDTLDGRSTT